MTDELHLALQDTHGPLSVVAVSGDIDFHTAPRLRAGGLELIGQGHRRLILDLTGVTFCDSAGLSAMIGLWHAAQEAGGSLALAAVPDRLLNILTVTGLRAVLPVHATAAEALAPHQQGA
ncbi:STAS domain-containing protein [Streptomyces sp. NPDC016459]|uniref:STAS domain-containing protein n=1 Tax=Streptomyces sp. NPDC016459 TaxID=3157190 RepID=UPI00340B6FF9